MSWLELVDELRRINPHLMGYPIKDVIRVWEECRKNNIPLDQWRPAPKIRLVK